PGGDAEERWTELLADLTDHGDALRRRLLEADHVEQHPRRVDLGAVAPHGHLSLDASALGPGGAGGRKRAHERGEQRAAGPQNAMPHLRRGAEPMFWRPMPKAP